MWEHVSRQSTACEVLFSHLDILGTTVCAPAGATGAMMCVDRKVNDGEHCPPPSAHFAACSGQACCFWLTCCTVAPVHPVSNVLCYHGGVMAGGEVVKPHGL